MTDLKPLIEHPQLNQLLDDIRQRANAFEEQRHIDKDIIERFKEIGVYRAFVPKRFGGEERTPSDFLSLMISPDIPPRYQNKIRWLKYHKVVQKVLLSFSFILV